MRNCVCHSHAQQLDGIDEEDGGGSCPRSVKHEPQELVHAPDIAPAENRRQFVPWAQVGVSICEQGCGRVDKSPRKGRAKAVRRTLRTSSYSKNFN